jgi:hypothetical protein
LVNHVGQNLHHIFGHNDAFDLNAIPAHGIDLNHLPHQLEEAHFIELNDMIQPDHPNNDMLHVVVSLPAPVQIQQEDVDMLPNGDNQSDITVIVSSENTLTDASHGSVNGGPHNAQQQQLHIGMALTPGFHVDPVLAASDTSLSTKPVLAASDS